MDNRLVRFTKGLLDLMFYLGILVTLAVPAVFKWVGNYLEDFKTYYLPQTVLYMLSGIASLLIILELRRMFATVLKDDAFVMENVESLKRMAWCSFAIAAFSILRLLYAPTPATAVVVLVFFIAGLFSLVLSQVFEKAIRYKEENDLTI